MNSKAWFRCSKRLIKLHQFVHKINEELKITPISIVYIAAISTTTPAQIGLMANKGQPNDYEKIKLLRVQDNKRRLHELGIKNITDSLASLVESKKTKKKKVKPTHSNARDVGYTPEMGEDNTEDYVEVATSVEVTKKPHRSQYIAPMAMNKVVNLGKNRRVIASKFSDPETVKHNHSKSVLTMGEVISSNKGARQQEVLKQNFAKASTIKGGSKKHFTLVDEDDDIFQDAEEVDMEPISLEEDGNEGYNVRTQGYVDQDDEYEDMDLFTTANNDDEIQRDDIEDEYDALVEDQLHDTRLERAIANTRGPTMIHDPVGPKDVVGKFSRFLGTIARNNTYAPLIYTSWKKVPHKEKILEYVLGKYDVPDAAKTWILKTIGHAYKVHKCRFKKKHFYEHKDNKTRWKNRPKSIPEEDFTQLLRLWSKKDVVERCLRAREVRMSQKNMHTAGPKSFARIRDEMRNDNPNKELPSLSQIFERTRKMTEGRAYLDTYDDTAKKIE
ncbi:hypothetical protein QVD17_19774 [Tagetes erecta]|uniref:Transposase n=1 Tax=Tagetes erecta TaxID=13708 RepID=A0AAD8NXH9_TARER|nr:hypothetical protein QVD17_19774 [Tagetes erecta]